MFVEQGCPGIRGKLVEVHAGEGALVQEVSAVSFVELEKRVRNFADDLSAGKVEGGRSDRWQRQGVVNRSLGPEIAEVVFGQTLDAGYQVYCHYRVVSQDIDLVKRSAGYRLVPREACLVMYLVGSHAGDVGAVRSVHRHIAVGIDAAAFYGNAVVEPLVPLVDVAHCIFVHRADSLAVALV